jgi:hypothetical protein
MTDHEEQATPQNCPVCGSKARNEIDGRALLFVACSNARCLMAGPWGRDPKEAILQWNRLTVKEERR